MYRLQNLHTHTTYVDGKDKAEELVLEAMSRGFESIGFSEHSHVAFSNFPRQLTLERADEYKREIRELKRRYADRIGIFCGLEYDFYSDMPKDDYDYVIGSVHYLECDGGVYTFDRRLDEARDFISTRFGGNAIAFTKKYFETMARLPERGRFDIIGHFDLVSKNNARGGFFDESSREYLSYGCEAIRALRGKIPLFEVNTGAIARGYRMSPYPAPAFLAEFKRCGFGAVISSDCHDKQYLDYNFEDARELLRSVGFRSRWVLTDGGFEEVEV